jgi:N-acetylneuraminic acid mutarotase
MLICSLTGTPDGNVCAEQCENQKPPAVKKNTMDRPANPQSLPNLPRAITSFGAVRMGDWVYAYGGHFGKPHHYSIAGQSNQLQRVHMNSNSKWETVATGPKLQGLAMVEHNGVLYRVGGLVARNQESEEQDLYSQPNFARFDPKTGKWESLPPMPEARSSFDAAMLGEKLYVAGGWAMNGEGNESTWLKSAYAVDLSRQPIKWKRLTNPPFERRAVSVGAVNGKIVVVGGIQPNGKVTRDCAVFDPETGKWSDGPKLPSGEMEGFGTACCTVDGQLYVSTISGRLLQFSNDKWEQVRKLRSARFFHQMVPARDASLILIGGANMETGKFSSVDVVDVGNED